MTTVHIAGIEQLSGPSGAIGQASKDGEEYAASVINAAGGVTDANGHKYKVDIKVDDFANAQEAIALARKAAATSDVTAIVGLTSSAGYVPLVPLAGSQKIPLVGTQPGAPIKNWNSYAYRVGTVSSQAVPVVLKTIVAKNDVKAFAVIYDQTLDSQVADKDQVVAQAPTLGYKVVSTQAFKSGTQSFSSQLTAILANKPDAVWIAAQTQDIGGVVQQLRGLGYKGVIATGFDTFDFPSVWDASDGGVKDGYTWIPLSFANAQGPLAEFISGFEKANPGQTVTSQSVYGYDVVSVVMQAVAAAGSTDRTKVMQALQKLDLTTDIGTTVKFDNPPSGENDQPTVTVVQVTGSGKHEEVVTQ